MSKIQQQFEAAMAAPEEQLEQRAARYERGLRALAACTLTGVDYGDWVQQVCTDLLEGLEATCYQCGTFVHDGPCVSEDEPFS